LVIAVEAAEVVAAARRVLTAVPYGFLTTLGTTRPSVRMVGCLGLDGDLRVTFGTGRHTRKAAELKANATAIYAAADLTTGAAVCLYGTATIDEDLSRRRSAWGPGLERYFPGGPEDPEFVLVSINPDRVEMWSEQDRVHPDPFGMTSAVVLRSADGWAGPTTTGPVNQ
jgi:general stress protein 26